MPAEPLSPIGALELLTICKETSFGQKPAAFNANGVGQAFNSFPSSITTQTIQRSPRGSLLRPVPAPAGRSLQSSLDVETTQDTIGQILAYGLGKQTIYAASAMYSGTLNAATIVNQTTVQLTANTLYGGNAPSMLFPGGVLTVDSGGAHPEQFTITSVSWAAPGVPTSPTYIVCNGYVGTPGTGFAFSHLSSAVVLGSPATKAMNVITAGSPLPTFTAQINRPLGASVDRLGCKIDTLALSFKPKTGLSCKANVCIQNELVDASPNSPTLSAKNPYIMEQLFVDPVFNGITLSDGTHSSLRQFDVTVNNNLLKDNFVGGNGNLVYNWPEQIRSVSGSIMLGFESQAEFNAFQSNAGGGPFQYFTFTLPLQSIDQIGTMQAFMVIYFPKVSITKWGATDDTSKEITQQLTLEMGDSVPGAGDAIQIYYPQATASAF